MKGRDPSPMESAFAWAWARTQKRLRGFWWGTVGIPALAAVLAATGVPPSQASLLVRAAIGLAGFVLALLTVAVLVFSRALMVAPYQQRNALRESLEAMEELQTWLPEGVEGDIQRLLAQHFRNV